MDEHTSLEKLEKIAHALTARLPGSYGFGDDALNDEELIMRESFLPLFVFTANQYSIVTHGKRILPFITVKDNSGLCSLNIAFNDEVEDTDEGGSGFVGTDEIPESSLWSIAALFLAGSMRQTLGSDLNHNGEVIDLSNMARTVISMVDAYPEGQRLIEQSHQDIMAGFIKECEVALKNAATRKPKQASQAA